MAGLRLKKNKKQDFVFSKKALENDIISQGKSLKKSESSTKELAKKIAEIVTKWVNERHEITEKDLNHKTAEVLENLDPDLSYVYKNRGKII